MPKRRRARVDPGGRPTLFPNPKPRTITLTDKDFAKAQADAAILAKRLDQPVSASQVIAAAIRAFKPRRFTR